ncbi:MAG: 2-polyprenylphenol 6-hydroxylase [Gammaproteobacteria bacterium]|nr:2-polyprenylphenol 6-hydroxylase [Gammaproteobacteria bacterium]
MLFKPFRQIFRIVKIIYIMLKFGLDRALFNLPLFSLFKSFFWFNPFYWHIRKQKLTRGERLRLALEALGPLFIKFGQILSTRYDVLPDDIVESLAKLQDQVKPFDSNIAIQTIESELGGPIDQFFDHFEKEAFASASISQVHAARLKTGEEVIIKVLRPHIKEEIAQDISILNTLAKILERISGSARRIHATGIVDEINRTLQNELDLVKEAANASQLRRQFLTDPRLYIPKIYWEVTRTKVLVMERVYGIAVGDADALHEKGFSLLEVATVGIQAFYTQVFSNAFFHADMHPGNIFIASNSQAHPCWILIDFGIVGTLSKEDQYYLASNFLAFIDRDYRRVAELHLESGWVPKNVRIDVLESAIRGVCEPIFELPQNQISMGQTLFRLIKIAREFKMEVMPQLLLLQKTLVNVEGLARKLAPEINMWLIARPILEKWMKSKLGWKSLLHRLKEQLPTLNERLPEIPHLIFQALKNVQSKQENPTVDKHLPPTRWPLFKRWTGFILGLLIGIGIMIIYFHKI